ncbi:beta-ketoacyl-[acyl-carrier-protein] synthase family protein [Danxiaibacter flavus]|uniref:3-oxoacyl-[acyl-carrier-protein] synthase 1 n=1 Tax=Danxiaibacter flavus TaxID=3049108 RepID=A0ABV3ZF25_9BACT|nr:beta-ketoacyl-[acyl-carrier-protein] synthase family protein [Chitinophagaceae bacterium DXS]
MSRRVVVTGLGVVSPNGVGIPAFLHAIQNGISGLKFVPQYKELNFNSQVCGVPPFELEDLKGYLSDVAMYGLKASTIGYAIKAAADAWLDAGNTLESNEIRWETGCVFGNSVADTEAMKRVISYVDAKQARKLGSRMVEQLMNSGATAYISGLLGLGNRVITNSAACATGSQAVLMGYEYIKHGIAKRMVVGSNEYIDPYIFGAFDSMRVLARKFNDEPEKASRPMSATANGFIPGSGAGALVIEDLEFALARNATIYAEILGGDTNSGGQRDGGTMTAPNPKGIASCITNALHNSGVLPQEIDLISGHLTATAADKMEIESWASTLNRRGDEFPLTNSLKSMIGHCLSAAGSIEIVAVILQIMHKFVHPNINLEDPNPDITNIVSVNSLPTQRINKEINIAAKANFGFGDVNTCLIFSKFK